MIWTERINSRDRNKDLKVKNIQGAVLLELLSYVKFKVNWWILKNNKDISEGELRLQLSDLIKTCLEDLVILGMENMEKNNIRGQYIFPPKFLSLTKDMSTPSEYLLCDDLNEKLDSLKTSQQMLQHYSPYNKNFKKR